MAPNDRHHDSENVYKNDAAPLSPPSGGDYFGVHAFLRVLLFAVSLASIILMVTAKQTELVTVPGLPIRVPVEAKFSHSPAFIYLISALSVSGLYGILTAVASLGAMSKPNAAIKYLLHFALWDVLLLGILAAATGASGGAGYIGLKGNSHAGYRKVCDVYGKYCRHFGSSIALSLVGSILLLLLVMLSVFSLHRRIPK